MKNFIGGAVRAEVLRPRHGSSAGGVEHSAQLRKQARAMRFEVREQFARYRLGECSVCRGTSIVRAAEEVTSFSTWIITTVCLRVVHRPQVPHERGESPCVGVAIRFAERGKHLGRAAASTVFRCIWASRGQMRFMYARLEALELCSSPPSTRNGVPSTMSCIACPFR